MSVWPRKGLYTDSASRAQAASSDLIRFESWRARHLP